MSLIGGYRVKKTGLLTLLKSLVSEHLWTVNMLKGAKDRLNLRGSIFVIFFWYLWKEISSKSFVSFVCETLRRFVKILTPDEKYSLSVKMSVWRKQFKCIYVKMKTIFLNFFLNFQNLHKI